MFGISEINSRRRRTPRTAAATDNKSNATNIATYNSDEPLKKKMFQAFMFGLIFGCGIVYYAITFDARLYQVIVENDKKSSALSDPNNDGVHRVAGLSCEIYGGDSIPKDVLEDMVYWQDIPSDSDFKSPFLDDEKFMTFQPDGGGWNNIRMGMETAVLMAASMGRTLVLPPEKKFYLLGKQHGGKQKQKHQFSFNDFFHMDSLSKEHKGLSIITMEEFLKREALTGRLTNKHGKVIFPESNRIDWNGIPLGPLWEYLSEVGDFPGWGPADCLAAFPASSDQTDVLKLQAMMQEINDAHPPISLKTYDNNPTDVDAPAIERMKENRANRKDLCIYDETMQNARLVHFKNGYPHDASRLLVPYYAFLFFQDWKQDLWSKRFIRDHVRYVDELMCAAARIVDAIHKRAKANNPVSNPKGLFNTMHVRRGDFQYKETRIEALEIYNTVKDTFDESGTIYIATDEKSKSFFYDLKMHYDICFLEDFLHLVPDVNTNYYGMLDQIIASKGELFFGTFYSTFSSYIHRLRGYHATKRKSDGHDTGGIGSYYFVPKQYKFAMKKYTPVKKPFWAREFPVSWRDIDKDVEWL